MANPSEITNKVFGPAHANLNTIHKLHNVEHVYQQFALFMKKPKRSPRKILLRCSLWTMHGKQLGTAENNRAAFLAWVYNKFGSDRIMADENRIINLVSVLAANLENAIAVLKQHGVLAMHFGTNRIRAVVHRDVNDSGMLKAITAFRVVV
uniref:Aminotran_5 domain-containing protein n=1 Tax=Panagrellus redivivus TaxID=6233 RepID=A0A7E4VVA2_PANRE